MSVFSMLAGALTHLHRTIRAHLISFSALDSCGMEYPSIHIIFNPVCIVFKPLLQTRSLYPTNNASTLPLSLSFSFLPNPPAQLYLELVGHLNFQSKSSEPILCAVTKSLIGVSGPFALWAPVWPIVSHPDS